MLGDIREFIHATFFDPWKETGSGLFPLHCCCDLLEVVG